MELEPTESGLLIPKDEPKREVYAPDRKHSPEPWHTGEQTCMGGGYNYYSSPMASDGTIIWEPADGPSRMKDADMDRIVACVNFMAHVPTEVIDKLLDIHVGGATFMQWMGKCRTMQSWDGFGGGRYCISCQGDEVDGEFEHEDNCLLCRALKIAEGKL